MKGLAICGTGRCLPARVVSNELLSQTVDTSDAWISSRTGIQQRYFCGEETNADLAVGAARQALEQAGIAPEQVGACVVATFSPDFASPSVACLVQARLGLPEDIPAFDLNAGCTGFLYGLQVVRGLLAQQERPYALLIGSEVISRVLDFSDRATCVLFGDGAGAAVLSLEEGRPYECLLGARGDAELIWVQGPGPEKATVHMDGSAVYRFAVEIVPHCVRALLEKANLTLDDISWIVPHQANRRIIETAARRLSLPIEKFYQNMERYGNTSAASVPIALDEMNRAGLLLPGQKLLCIGFGAGLTWGGALLQW